MVVLLYAFWGKSQLFFRRFHPDLFEGYDFQLLEDILEKLMKPELLEFKNKDHDLKGEYKGFRECHISPDWLLIYRYNGGYLELSRTGIYSDLFRE